MKVIIPMAGLGSRFAKVGGYDAPKPLIHFLDKPMIQHVIEHLGLQEHKHIFLCQKDHIRRFGLEQVFSTFVKDFEIVKVDGLTSGAATTVSLAASKVNDNDEVLIVNSDQLVHWDKNINFIDDGTIFCFHGEGPKWSYAKLRDDGFVTQVAEKVQISNHATSGMYHWKKFEYFLEAYDAMVFADDRTNNEFYVAPVYNYALHRGITIRYVDGVDQVGTPEELEDYLEKQK